MNDLGQPRTESKPVIYHGTPMTPRPYLLAEGAGRAFCVSFYRPDDAEAVATISPRIMFRQWCIFRVAGGFETGRGMVFTRRLDGLLPLAGAAPIPPRTLGCDPRRARSSIATQRQPFAAMAFWTKGRTALAHGRADRSVVATVRTIRARLPRLDRAGIRQAGRLRSLVPQDGPDSSRARQSLARASHDARCIGCPRVPIRHGRCDKWRAEWALV